MKIRIPKQSWKWIRGRILHWRFSIGQPVWRINVYAKRPTEIAPLTRAVITGFTHPAQVIWIYDEDGESRAEHARHLLTVRQKRKWDQKKARRQRLDRKREEKRERNLQWRESNGPALLAKAWSFTQHHSGESNDP